MENDFNSVIQSLANTAKTRQEVAGEYGITVNTLKSQLHKNGIELPTGLIYPKTLIIIYSVLGIPSTRKGSSQNA